jgi:hypothetical protein
MPGWVQRHRPKRAKVLAPLFLKSGFFPFAGDLEEIVIYAIKLHELKAKLFMISVSYFAPADSCGGRADAPLI